MVLKKKIILWITMLLCAALFYACGKKEEAQNDLVVDGSSGDIITEAENTGKSQEMNPQTVYAIELERQEDIELDEEDGNLTDDSDLIEKINKYMIPEQSFDISLNDWGNVTFVSCMPMPDSEGVENLCADVSFYLISDE